MDVIDAKDRFLARMPREAAQEARAGMELTEAEGWPDFHDERVQRILGAVLLASIQHGHMMSLACAYAIGIKLVFGVGHWTPPTPLPPLTSK